MADRRYGPLARSWVASYGFAIAIGLGSVVVSRLAEHEPGSEPVYAFLVGAVAISVWYGGAASGLITLTIGWSLAPFVLYADRAFSFKDPDDLDRWGLSLVAALAVVWVSLVMRRGQERAATAADVAERSSAQMERLQELSAGLSNAVSVAEVAHVITGQAAANLGAQGAALGLIAGEDLEIVDPSGLAARAHVPGKRLALDQRTLLTRSAREGVVVRVDDRETIASSFSDSALLLPPSVQAAVAIPLRAMGEVVGVVGFLFERRDLLTDETVATAQTIAGLAEQALERARLYELEREGRQALDRILRVAPHFHAETVQEVIAVICREARVTFGGDYGVLWQLRDSRLVLLNSDPVRPELPRGLEVPLDDFSGLAEAVANHDVSFSPDVLVEARGIGLERVRRMGVRSSLRSPIVIGGSAGLVLAVSWRTVVSEPERSTVVLMRRFADQAGLALEQLERRQAEAEAARRAEDAVRLQEATAALSLAATPSEVAETGLEHALSVCGDAGFVVLTSPHEVTLEFAASRGFGDVELDSWRAFGLDTDVPFARAIVTGEPVWALKRDEMGAFTQTGDFDDAGWVALPLKRGTNVQGALHLTFRRPREVSEAGRSWLESVASQCALALERSRLLEEEKLRRVRSERLQSMTEALSNALTEKDVAELVVEVLCDELEPDAASVSSLVEDRATLKALAWRGYPDELADDEISLDADTPETRAARGRVWRLYTSEDADPRLESTEPVSYLVAPLIAGRRRIGVLAASWNTPTALGREDRSFVENMAGQAALALDRARVFESERATAETLQRSVLPASLPRVAGVQLAARYLPGAQGVAVGGDWFDALELHDGRLGLVVGDVMGKGVHAAASMGQLRNALRAFAVERLKPSSALARLDRLGDETLESAFATVVYAVVDPRSGVVRFSSAGHPPPVVAYADGRVELLEEGRGLPLGTGMRPQYRQAVAELPAGSVLVLYSDGLVERRGQSIDDGLRRLVAAVRDASKDPEHLLEHILDEVVGDAPRGDDIALLAARLLPVAPQPLELRLPTTIDALHVVRDALRTWTEGTPLGRPEAEGLVLAAWEASANAIEHAVGLAESPLVVCATQENSTIRVTVEDRGRWVPPSDRPGRGFGLQLMRSLTSSVEIVPGAEERGTRVTIECATAGTGGPLKTAR
ncbi:MAG TPA: SpoIIE family protein phosphatase [Gaiellaceae bacterium]|nr:SpoIIE family protein phosphatase [Gaiellaceae bacterium]